MAAALGAARRALLRCSAASSASTASMERFLSSRSISSSVSSRFSRLRHCFCFAHFHAFCEAWELGVAIGRFCNPTITRAVDSMNYRPAL
ncbi:hypothetical protein HPP92_004485 [Vanilla planifolia]|uniref:Uncharacterized protein n=1 Tax=Vanilla planifolia TaxID=51239 RepID=A0A835RT74_VANPL|nr:hypothetical protein HPP92_004860 [Vanilla planifolia]KAG0493491.1 hypothetical protein HPP92_004485 [Vanilla planifolia]